MQITEEFFDNRTQASQACARRVAATLKRRLGNIPRDALIVGGGSTPEECFKLLADTDLDWRRVDILPSDERCVPTEHDASNEGMIRRLLITSKAANASLLPLFDEDLPADELCLSVEKRLESIMRPFSTSLLGMGEDGHFASLFPDAEELSDGLDQNNDSNCMLVRTSASLHARISLTLPLLLDCSEVLLLFFGENKRDVYEQAKRRDSEYPVSKLLQQQRTPIRAIWAP